MGVMGVVVAEEDGVEIRESARRAGRVREALGREKVVALLKDGVKQGAKTRGKLYKIGGMADPCGS